MSVHYIHFIPAEPMFVPRSAAQHAAVDVLRAARPDADDISTNTGDYVTFVDCGENFERVGCPACDATLQVETWQALMDADYADDLGFQLAPITLPCCGNVMTLNELRYEWPQGFSRFAMTAMNAGGEVPRDLLERLESVLGCRLRVIYQML
jgi:hypothetical protein